MRRPVSKLANSGPVSACRAVLFGLAILGLSAGYARALSEVSDFGPNPGNLRMHVHIPERLAPGRPLVVALHGCRQQAADYDQETGWERLAETWQFALLLPEQKRANNVFRCFNWFNGRHLFYDWFYWWSDWGSDIDRDSGEALSIRQMIDRVISTHQLDPDRVFITGLSAGGAMTAVMLATYPERFAGGAIIAGVPYKCATHSGDALSRCGVGLNHAASVPIRDLSPHEWGNRVREASDHRGPWPRISIWQGTADKTVNPDNAVELLEQWLNVHRMDADPEVEDQIQGYAHRIYQDDERNDLVEMYWVLGLDHGTPVDPGSDAKQCGTPARYVLDADICSSYHIGRFWGLE